MVKRVLSLALGMILILGVLVGLLVFSIPGNVKAETHIVNPGESIQSAIDGAQPGDTISVSAGTYNENVSVKKSIRLVGEDAATTILNAGGVPSGIIISSASSASVESLTIKNANFGVTILQSTDCEIRDVIVKECNSGIDADNDDDLRIRECDFTGFGVGTGIDAFEVIDLRIENNSFTLYLNGMSLRYSDGPYIFGNSLVSNLDNGIILEQFEDGLVRNNHIENHASNGIRINYGTDIELEDNTIHNITGKGVSVTWADFVMKTTTIEEAGYGVYFQDISNGEIYNCSISESENADLYVSQDSLKLINTTFDHDKVIIAKSGAILTVINFIEVVVENSQGSLIEGISVQVKQNEQVIYDSQEGGEPTNEKGTIGLLAVLYGLFEYSSSSNYSLNTNVIGAGATYNSIPVPFDGPDPENIDMSTSKKAIFIVDTLPPVISEIALFGNKSITTNTLDRSHDDTLAISFNADESGEYLIIFDSNRDGEFNESNDIFLTGSVSPGLQSIYWIGGNDTFLLSDGHYSLKFNVRDEFANWLSEPFTAITIIIKNSDLDGDGHLDISDDLPSDPTQWFDNDGDGYGDNPEGNDADLFPQDPTQWFDSDGDGYGDNPLGTNPDKFPEEETQWMDTDGDGYGDNVSGENGDAFPEDETQWLDSDGDGYGENLSGNKPDAFPKNTLEWEDSDGDGYGDNAADAFPDDPDEWLDEDGDGFGDNSDFLPGVNNWLMFFIIGVTVVIVLVGFYFFRGQKKSERPFDPGVSSTSAAPAAAPVTTPIQPQQPAPAAEKPKPAPPKKKAPPKPEPKKEAPPAKPAKKEEEPPPPPPPPPEDE